MPVRKANAVWDGDLRSGKGTMKFGTFEGPYSFSSRFEEGKGSNPEELIGAAHAGCFSMALAGNLFKAGSRIAVKISCVDDEPKNPLELIGTGSLRRTAVSRVTVFHNEDYPSYLLLPITKGNILNTYFSGGKFPG